MKEVVSALCGMCCEPLASAEGGDGGGGDGGDGDSGGISPASAAAQALDCLACFCPAQHIHPQVWGSVWDKCRRSVDTWPSTAPCSTLTRRCAVSPATARHIVGVIKYWDDRSRPTAPPPPPNAGACIRASVLRFRRRQCPPRCAQCACRHRRRVLRGATQAMRGGAADGAAGAGGEWGEGGGETRGKKGGRTFDQDVREGQSGFVRPTPLFPHTLPPHLFQDPDQRVRGAAAFALGQFSEHLQPEIVEHYETVLPALFAAMHGAMPSVQV